MLVALIVVKPEDIPIIIKKIQEFKLYCSAIKNQALVYITKDLKIDNDILESNAEQLNFYLERIINIQGYYDGNYSLDELKAKYDELIKIKSTKYVIAIIFYLNFQKNIYLNNKTTFLLNKFMANFK